ncbi:MAG: ABC transporter ATP-binding protein [Rhizobiales bacterium]|nr:ABC transporter ATP-binding protein [Hyphomicrobiales bacterium]MBO6699086.1 ABC transporter ATP-binding protein [Hyphomicrobiales bacterium]MBO6736624.1 ABC transporter ATP-binding protein [Hyphomicrobiales bacterium]MBO6912302.1 ABC transporter ATP-binding protein [Hyphomicrobiales bacterium]MBO6956548.1 ABC transporter ATP-binding protein [Hyphomicrobiales bacterium]
MNLHKGTPVLELSDITMRFGPLVANDAISITLGEGEILALLGENGAGKTTLMNILFGHYTADEGSVKALGETLPPGKPRAAIEAGVGMVHQHFTLAGNLTVLENVMLGSQPLTKLTSGREAAEKKLQDLADRFGLPVHPHARIADLSVGERQRVEILKALYRDARILILDEPTAVLARPEAERLFFTLRDMASKGLSIIFISHKLHEVMAGSDRVTVLRGGKVVAERKTAETNPAELAALMVGRQVARPKRESQAAGAPVISARNVSFGPPGERTLDAINFEVRAGEILGIVGVSGNGQSALGALLSGLTAPSDGEVLYAGDSDAPRNMATLTPRQLVEAGIGRIPEDRHAEGMVGEFAVWENMVLEQIKTDRFARRGFVRRGAGQAHATDLIERFDVRGAGPQTRTRLLSGGNMQKLILARVLAAGPRFIIANQPTRGLDEGAIAAVHEHLLNARKEGAAILLISEELEEATALSDRIQAILKGRLSAPITAEEASAERLGLMMAGMWGEADAA